MPALLFRNVPLWNEISTHLKEWAETAFISLIKIWSYINNTQTLSPFPPVCSVCTLLWVSTAKRSGQALFSWGYQNPIGIDELLLGVVLEVWRERADCWLLLCCAPPKWPEGVIDFLPKSWWCEHRTKAGQRMLLYNKTDFFWSQNVQYCWGCLAEPFCGFRHTLFPPSPTWECQESTCGFLHAKHVLGTLVDGLSEST